MSKEAPELCKSDVLSSPHGPPPARQERGCLFSFSSAHALRKLKGHLSESAVGDRTRSKQEASPLCALKLQLVAMEKLMN